MTAVLTSEAAWLNGDAAVTAALAGGQVLPYIREEPAAGGRVCWLFRVRIDETRDTNQLKRVTHALQIRIKWPLESAGANVLELQTAADVLVDALMVRIRDVTGDKTHGWASWVAQSVNGIGQPGVAVSYADAEHALRQGLPWQIDLSYTAIQDSITG